MCLLCICDKFNSINSNSYLGVSSEDVFIFWFLRYYILYQSIYALVHKWLYYMAEINAAR